MYNPDYPTDQGYGFAQHTYQPTPTSDMFYWGGSNVNGFGQPANDGSRRNMLGPMNPVNPAAPNPFQQYGNQNTTIPENAVQPFSSYPPSTPMPNGGLNSMVESRRNAMTTTPAAVQNNPWAVKTSPPVATPPGYPPQNSGTGWGTPNPYGYGPNEYNSLYANNSSFTFDKHGRWDNYYTQNKPFPMPNINWNAPQQPQPNPYGYPTGYPGYNPATINQFPTAPMNWKDKATENWSL